MNNPMDMIKNLMKQGNPRQLVEKMVMNNSNPIMRDLVQKAQNGDTKGIEEFARNFLKGQGMNYDDEFNKFMNDLGLKK